MKTILSIWRVFWLLSYYGIARHLPASYRFQPLGHISRQVRVFICKRIFKSMGENVNVERGASFGWGAEIEIGSYSGMGINCQFPHNVRIGSDVMIAPDVLIISQSHRFENLEIPMRLQGDMPPSPVTIEDDVWIGARVIILPGVTISKGAIIGAGAVVTRDVPPYAVCVGNPARVVRYRNESVNRRDRDHMSADGKAS